jgi:hypothetical protein
MKNFLSNGALILLAIAVLYIIFLRECKKPEPCPAEGEMIISIDAWKKIQELVNAKPTIHIDTLYITGPTVYVPGKPLPNADPDDQDTTINSYSDSLIQKDINAWYRFKVHGTLIERQWAYKPIITSIHEIDSIPYPVYVTEVKELLIPQRGLYLYGIGGGNANTFIFGGGLDYITKKNTEIGYLFQRYGTENFHSVKLGIKLFNKQK